MGFENFLKNNYYTSEDIEKFLKNISNINFKIDKEKQKNNWNNKTAESILRYFKLF